jgi:hypothetical protein
MYTSGPVRSPIARFRSRADLSSTIGELAAERHAVVAAITQLHYSSSARALPAAEGYRAMCCGAISLIGIYGQSWKSDVVEALGT